ncbi:MAG: hypothetical protein R3A47_03875 [Polyangiales bacterium]
MKVVVVPRGMYWVDGRYMGDARGAEIPLDPGVHKIKQVSTNQQTRQVRIRSEKPRESRLNSI